MELFPTGGGGYLVASKLLSPSVGMMSGCALLVDYILTITLSIASAADAIFSFLPANLLMYRVSFAVFALILLIILNLRGVKESVLTLMPIFLIFVFTHIFAIIYSFGAHWNNFPVIAQGTVNDVRSASSEFGFFGMIFLVLRAYSMGAGTYTGIEAVSNGLPILREPKVQTGRRTMQYMAFSLALMVLGLMIAYMLYGVQFQSGKTLNAVLFESLTAGWGHQAGNIFVLITLLSEAAILYVASQAGFIDGPRVLSNMAIDRWVPSQFSMLSDRLVTQNGVLLMGISSLVLMLLTGGSVQYLIVLYSINVFITFVLSQLGMVRHWWQSRKEVLDWFRKLAINGFGLILTTFILLSVIIVKFNEGGWITLLVTGTLIAFAIIIKHHYVNTTKILKRLDSLVVAAEGSEDFAPKSQEVIFDPNSKTAAILVNGFNGLGLHTLFGVIRNFGGVFKNFIFVSAGIIDAGNFKGKAELDNLEKYANSEVNKYVNYMRNKGYYAEGITSVGIDVIDEISVLVPKVFERFPNAVFFGGQLVFPEEKFLTRWLHNYTVFAIQRKLYHQGIPIVMLPIRVETGKTISTK
ncbi:MAG: APC family permease [Elusimicrobia bacterium]|nr:APC family permease [Elusimicrobiota bacterium]